MKHVDDQLEVIRKYPLASLVTCDGGSFFVTQVPLYLRDAGAGHGDKEEGVLVFRGHLSKGNPQVHHLMKHGGAMSGLVMWRGPDAYISPHFFSRKAIDGAVVPTWDYVVVEGQGTVTLLDKRHDVEDAVSTLSNLQEQRTGGHWTVSDAPREFLDSQLQKIVGIEITVTKPLVGRWKLSQDASSADVCTIVRGLASRGETDAAETIAKQRGGCSVGGGCRDETAVGGDATPITRKHCFASLGAVMLATAMGWTLLKLLK
eukprot:CAMPEP_0176441158 /NCGR_PEP_ID=MMETSP0127-20121128/21028_1 /TAXON_ID=938130 /ORGANISM="Platyophrya macrostoma, Strain WH" /LENGTH=259 /DNA_ID=CAMNT_0017825877 /DNA_START=84 /DNA_END=863 /DNA_ORIENTATION=-